MELNVSEQARTGRDWIERERTSRGGAGCDVFGGDRARQDGIGRARMRRDGRDGKGCDMTEQDCTGQDGARWGGTG